MESPLTLAQCLQPENFFDSFDGLYSCLDLAEYSQNNTVFFNQTIASSLVQLIDTCMQSYCQQGDSGLCSINSTALFPADGFPDFNGALCGNISNVKPVVNSEIGGIGVSTFPFLCTFFSQKRR
jgi:hypothetical protein